MAYSATEVLEWIKEGENPRVAIIRSELGDPAHLARLISSFANREGGVLLVGIGPEGEVLGADTQRAVQVFYGAL